MLQPLMIAQKEAFEGKLDELFVSSSLMDRDSDAQLKFVHRSVQEYLIAQVIVNEITNFPETEFPSQPQNCVLNQKLLAHHSQVIEFIQDAYRSSKFDAQALLRLVKASKVTKPPQLEEEKIIRNLKEEKTKICSNKVQNKPLQPDSHHEEKTALVSDFSLAAANAITILNISKFDFRELNFSEVSIPEAYLSHGKFESTNFSGANLAGVNFTKAWLKDTDFTGANLSDTKFGVLPDLKFDKTIRCCEFSQNGQRLAVALGREIVIFEKNPAETFFRETRTIRGHNNAIDSISFS